MDYQNHSISNKGAYNFYSMAFYGFSKIFPVIYQFFLVSDLMSDWHV
jgi:hypothetical protein